MRRQGAKWVGVLAIAVALLPGCALTTHFAYTNTELTAESPPMPQASFEIRKREDVKQYKNVLVLLALSGGGSRAAYFSARAMLALEKVPAPQGPPLNVLKEVDLISSVSGGSLAAAYYASSFDPGAREVADGRRVWDKDTVTDLMGRDYIARWIGNWFWPVNIAKFWLTAFDRTDIMAQTFADNFFDLTTTGTDLRFHDLNPTRPNLVLNSTVGSRDYRTSDPPSAVTFGTVFTFTSEDFTVKLNSDISEYELARAVMASATFPAVFNYMTLRDFHVSPGCQDTGQGCYVHLFDGGNFDNLGLASVKRTLLSNHAKVVGQYDRIVVVLVDAFRPSTGVNPASADPRGLLSYFVDTDFLDATDSLLEANRQRILDQFFSRTIAASARPKDCWRDSLPDHACPARWTEDERERVTGQMREKLFFFHVAFEAVTKLELKDSLNAIPTTFRLEKEETKAIEEGVANLFAPTGGEAFDCVRRLGEVLSIPGSSPVVGGNTWCGFFSPGEQQKQKELRKTR
ncbi:MAG TPA: patatin-like phospholipase family protein [Methylomirabilota bacterium]|nr:patatin-like phospholipase family protein [Methylomirabilota bacterium]